MACPVNPLLASIKVDVSDRPTTFLELFRTSYSMANSQDTRAKLPQVRRKSFKAATCKGASNDERDLPEREPHGFKFQSKKASTSSALIPLKHQLVFYGIS